MNRTLIRCGLLAATFAVGACNFEEKLAVDNPNDPGFNAVKGTPADLENFLGSLYRRWHSALYGTTTTVWGMAGVMSFEDFSTLSNNCQGQRVGIPRASNDNAVGNGCNGEQSTVYNRHAETARGAADALRRINAGLTFGSAALDARNRAWAEFIRGISLGYLALVYDSAATASAADSVSASGTAVAGQLVQYREVMDSALVALDNAETAVSTPGLPNYPSNWMFTTATLTPTYLKQIIRSYKARFRANVARYPSLAACTAGNPNQTNCAEEATATTVDWAKVIADAQNGITSDLLITTSTTTGPNMSWVNQWYSYGTWHQMTPFIFGMADKSGAYDAWIAQPLGTRGAGTPFLLQTDDQRFPQGATRAAQQADFTVAGTTGVATNPGCTVASTTCKRYFRNRDGSDPAASPSWGASQYDHVRHYSWKTSGTGTGQNGPFPFFTVAELNMLEAEGQIRTGNFAAAAALIDKTRSTCGYGSVPAGCTVRSTGNGPSITWAPVGGGSNVTAPIGGGLPKLAGVIADNSTPVPGGSACVPRIPVGASETGGGTTTCGNLFEAMKWEKRIEEAYTAFSSWYFDGRRWGDLPILTPVHWAVPYADLQVRLRTAPQVYSTGGGTNPTGNAARSGYGW
ncbi:MAG TPA: hypothetical protein VL241_02850 [Gemmatimonadales bacterium]|nr:hypothetical protein [Gemmatimonadales bacterium]